MKEFAQIVCMIAALCGISFIGSQAVTTINVGHKFAKLRIAYEQNGDRIIAEHRERAQRARSRAALLAFCTGDN